MKRHFIIFILLIAWSILPGQSPYFKNYQVRDGLPSNNVYFVFQDSKGYIWLCTDVGVSRFDGARFTNFSTADGLTDNEVFTCFEDSAGRIWFATLNGKPCFYQQNKILSEKEVPLLKGLSLDGLIINIFQEENGEIVLASGPKILRLDFEKGQKKLFSPDKHVLQVWPQDGNTLGALKTNELGEFHDGKFNVQHHLEGVRLPIKQHLAGDTLFLVYSRKLVIYNWRAKRMIQQITLPDQFHEAISVYVTDKWVWVGDRKGVFRFNRKTYELEKTYLQNRQVSAIIEDKEGGWWFSTLDNGIYYVPSPEIGQFTQFDKNGQPYKIGCLAMDATGRMWMGLNKGAFAILDRDSLSLHLEYPTSLAPRSINSIRHLPDGSTWLAGKAGVLGLKAGKKQFYRFRSSDLNFDHAGNIWTGLTGLYFVMADKLKNYVLHDREIHETPDPAYYLANPPKRLSDIRVDKIVFDEKNRAWLASSTGLYPCVDGKVGKPLFPYPTRDLQFDQNTNLLWAMTETNGLFVLQNGKLVDSIAIGNGQQQAICRGLCTDDQGNHWIASAKGVYLVAGEVGQLKLTDYSNHFGIGSQKLNAIAIANNKAYLGTDDGLMVAPIGIFAQKLQPPPVYIKSLEVNNQPSMSSVAALNLRHDENALTFYFEGLSFKDFKQLKYLYRLIGHETAWHQTSHEAVEYASLRPGNYRFEVYAVNSSGIKSAVPGSIAFTIAKPYWLQWWFLASLLLASAGLVFLWVKWRESRLRQQYELSQRMMAAENEKLELQSKNADLKMLALRLQMNPHFIFNALNTIKGYYGQAKITQANSYIAKFARLLRLNLDYSDTYIPLEQELDLLKIYVQLSQIRYPEMIGFEVNLSPAIVPSAIQIPSMVIQPFLENAIIHGIVPKQQKGNIYLHFHKTESGELQVIIKDDGIGRSASAAKPKLQDPHKPLATQITLERLSLLRKKNDAPPLDIIDLMDENGQPIGTEVRLLLPISPVNGHSFSIKNTDSHADKN